MVAPRALAFQPLVKGDEALGTRLRVDSEPRLAHGRPVKKEYKPRNNSGRQTFFNKPLGRSNDVSVLVGQNGDPDLKIESSSVVVGFFFFCSRSI